MFWQHVASQMFGIDMEQPVPEDRATIGAVVPATFNGTSNQARHAVAVLRGASCVMAFGERAERPTAFVSVDASGRAFEYLPFDGVTRDIAVGMERLSAVRLRMRVSRQGAADELFELEAAEEMSADLPVGQYAGRVEACQEAGPLKISITAGAADADGWALSCRIPGNCAAQASVRRGDTPGHYAVALRIDGPRGCSLNDRTLPGELALVGKRVLLTFPTDAGGILYLGVRTQA